MELLKARGHRSLGIEDSFAIRVGDSIEVSQHQGGAAEDRFLLLGEAGGMLDWDSPEPLSPSASEYVLQMPAPEMDQQERLRCEQRERRSHFVAGLSQQEISESEEETLRRFLQPGNLRKLKAMVPRCRQSAAYVCVFPVA